PDETQRKVDSPLDLKQPGSTSPAQLRALPAAALPLPAPAPLPRAATDSGPAPHAADLPTGAAPVDVGLPQAHSRTSLGSQSSRPGRPKVVLADGTVPDTFPPSWSVTSLARGMLDLTEPSFSPAAA